MLWIPGSWHAIVPALKTPEVKSNPAHKRLLPEEQHDHLRRLYLGAFVMPKAATIDLNTKFGTAYSVRQITEYLRARGWSAKRKKELSKGELAVPFADSVDVNIAEQVADAALEKAKAKAQELNNDFLEESEAFGKLVMAKAKLLATRSVDAKTLSSAASAGNTGISIRRKVRGLDDSAGKRPTNQTFNISFAKAPGSPFHVKVVTEQKPVEAELLEAGDQ